MLAQAQINLWVLTGDKLETAINIGYDQSNCRYIQCIFFYYACLDISYRYACRLLRQGMRLITVTLDTPDIAELERRKDRDAVALVSF